MAQKSDPYLAESLAIGMDAIMNSKKHKEMFTKQAQDKDIVFPEADVITGKTPTQKSFEKGMGELAATDKPSTSDILGQYRRLPGGATEHLPKGFRPKDTPPHEGQDPALERDDTSVFGPPGVLAKLENLSKNPFDPNSSVASTILANRKATPEQAMALNESADKINAAFSSKASDEGSILNSIVRIADYLGQNGFIISEAIADSLISNIVVEAKAKKKAKKAAKKAKKANKFFQKMNKGKDKEICEKCKECPCVCEKGKKDEKICSECKECPCVCKK